MTFTTAAGVRVAAVTAAQMRQVDRLAMEETGPHLAQMMENAGRTLALLAVGLLGPAWRTRRVVTLAGSGGNGGGGICAARHLANRGLDVQLCLARPDGLAAVPALQRQTYRFTSGREVTPENLPLNPPDLIIDALVGYGLVSAPRGITAELIEWANASHTPTLALDVPSGLDATTGEAPGAIIRPCWTMTLALPKTGLLPDRTGELFLADIGIPAGTYRRLHIPYQDPFELGPWVKLERG